MHGAASWEQIIFLATLLTTVLLGVGYGVGRLVYKFTQILRDDRHTLDAASKQRDDILEETIKEIRAEYGGRISALENYNAGLIVLLREMEAFRADVKERFESLHDERRDDMRELHKRIEALPGKIAAPAS